MEWILFGSLLAVFLVGFFFGRKDRQEMDMEERKHKVLRNDFLPNGGERLRTDLAPEKVKEVEEEFDGFLKLRRDKTVERIGHYEPEPPRE